LSATVTKFAISQLLSQQLITNVHYHDANTCCRNDAACW